MRTNSIITATLTFLVTCSLTACSAHFNWEYPGNPILSTNKETAELADVTADVLDLAERVGPENVLMVFDIDNTLLAMEQGLGADQWYEWQVELLNDDPCSVEYVGDLFAAQGALFFVSAMRPTQDDAASQVMHVVETFGGHECAHSGHDLAAHDCGPAGLGVGDQVQVALAVANFHIPQAVEFLRQGAHPLGQEG